MSAPESVESTPSAPEPSPLELLASGYLLGLLRGHDEVYQINPVTDEAGYRNQLVVKFKAMGREPFTITIEKTK